MDISLPLDQIQNSYGYACSLINASKQKSHLFQNFSLKKRISKATPFKFRCSLLNQGLRPRPAPKHLRKEDKIVKIDGDRFPGETRLKDSNFSPGICGQIEKMVLCKRYDEALELFEILECENPADIGASTYDALVGACIGSKSIRGVKRVFRSMLDSDLDMDLYLMNRVLLMHVKCGMMIDARNLFEEMPVRNVVSWNTIIMGLVDSGDFLDAFRLFLTMWEENLDVGSRSLASMIRASTGLGFIYPGKQIHSIVLKTGLSSDAFISCSLIDMYSKCGLIENAKSIFDLMPEKTTVAWNSIIAGYALHGYSEEALNMYYEMQDSGAKMDHFTYSIVIRVCTRLASLEHGKQAHASLVRNGFGLDIVANTALVDFYSKWGRIEDAQHVFEKMPQKNVVSWNALISGYGNHGRGHEAVELFERMVREKMVPNHVTFLAVLSACCYSGLSEIGWEIFESMSRVHKMKPRAMHYTCMVELLGREGLLDEALALIRDGPLEPTVNMWAALLTACRAHKNFELGKFAAEKIYGMDPEKLSNYIVLLNIYNGAGKTEEAARVFQTLRMKGLRMMPACTYIEVRKRFYVFFTGDKSHTRADEIYENLEEIMVRISGDGYEPEGRNLLPDVDEREQRMWVHHSEKLAVSFGLMSTEGSSPLQLVQSHRMCSDCHGVMKSVSKAYEREIVMRDGSRFHHFKDGVCSCGDYW